MHAKHSVWLKALKGAFWPHLCFYHHGHIEIHNLGSNMRFVLVVGPPLIEGRGVFVVFWSLCIVFYSILCCSRRAYGPFFKLFFLPFLVFLCFLGGVRGGFWGGVITFCRVRSTWLRSVDATLWTFFLDLYTFLMLRCELLELYTLLMLRCELLELYTLLMLRCELSS